MIDLLGEPFGGSAVKLGISHDGYLVLRRAVGSLGSGGGNEAAQIIEWKEGETLQR